ncbi:MAG: hypothetical protein ACXITV_10220 [Luteibaculaceae bacterium]
MAHQTKQLATKEFLIIFFGLLISYSLTAQDKVSDYYRLNFHNYQGVIDFYAEPDTISLNIDIEYGKQMFAFNVFLYEKYSRAAKYQDNFYLLLPDTNEIKLEHTTILNEDTAFSALYFNSLHGKEIPDIHLDTLLNIVSKFFYLHRENGRAFAHICAGINGLHELKDSQYSPYYYAFSFMVIYNERAILKLKSFVADLPLNFESEISEIDIQNAKEVVYENVLHDPEIKALLLETYYAKQEFLNFKIFY